MRRHWWGCRVCLCIYTSTVSLPSSTPSTSTILPKEALNVWKKIYFVWGKNYHCQRTLNRLLLRRWHFVFWFKHSKFSKVAKMIYNSTSDACSFILAPNLAIQSLKFDQNSVKTLQNNFISSTVADMLTSLWFLAYLHNHPNNKWNTGKVQSDIFMNLIYIYFSKRWRAVIGEGP